MRKKKMKKTFAEFNILFPNAPKKTKDREVLFNKFLSLIEETIESLPVKLKSYKRTRRIVLDSDDFMFIVVFGKLTTTRIYVNSPEKNIDIVNEIGNKVINFMNTILGEKAINSKVSLFERIVYPQKVTNLCKKLIGEPKLAKINEEVRQPLNPTGIYFEYELNGKDFGLATFSNEKSAEAFFCAITYKGKMPFNLLRKHYDELSEPAEIIKKLTEVEL